MLRISSRNSGARRVRSRFAAGADRARDRQDWGKATELYRRHLGLSPEDADIWVQLGHSLKEGGLHADSLSAYRAANSLFPDDADTMLHLAHALIVAGEVEEGVRLLQHSASAGNGQAAQDLVTLGQHAVVGSHQQEDLPALAILEPLSTLSDQLRATDFSDVQMLPDGELLWVSHDPWIVYEWREGHHPTTRFAAVTIEMSPQDASRTPEPQVYIDCGAGFSEYESGRFTMVDNKATFLLFNCPRIMRLRFDPDQAPNSLESAKITISPLNTLDEMRQVVTEHVTADPTRLIEVISDLFDSGDSDQDMKPSIITLDLLDRIGDYPTWVFLNANPRPADYRRMKTMTEAFEIKPRFSFVMPTYNTPVDLLQECLDSMLAQTYTDFEICIADDASPNPEVVAMLERYARRDARVKYIARPRNGHISASSNSALSLATGDFIVLVDHDDLIPDYALFVVAYYINLHPDADVLFSDEDKVQVSGQRLAPYFKSKFNKYLMYGHNMVSHLGVYRRTLIDKIGGFRLGLEGSQDYDLLFRCFEQSSEDRMVHIPHVLYHWRIIPGSTAMSADQKSYAVVAAQNAINGHFERQGMPLRSVDGFAPGTTMVKPSRTFDTPVSIIIPTRNGLDLLEPCIASIDALDHTNAEIIIVDNGSDDPETLRYLEDLSQREDVRVLRDPGAFNFSRINNAAAAQARGDILCFLNNDTEVLSGDWLNRARAFLSMDEVGMVGARMLFPDGDVQHAGIVLGMGGHGIAGAPHLGSNGNEPGYFGKARLLQEMSAVTAACMFVRKSDFDAVGGFEEELPVAYNDIDLCLKFRAAGHKILMDPDTTLIHKESRTRGADTDATRAERLNADARWMLDRWHKELAEDPYYSPNLTLARGDMSYAGTPRQPWPWRMPMPVDA